MENETKPLSPDDTTSHVTEPQSPDNTTILIQHVQDEQDRSTNTSFCTPCQKKSLLVVLVALVVCIGTVIGITLAVKNSSNTTTGNTTPGNTTTGNTSGQKDVKHQPNKVDSCIYITPQDYLKELEEDPFGKDCEHGSPYVKKTCYPPNASYPLCEHSDECEGKRLPSVCFCDKKIHCQKRGGGKPNDDGRESCSNCMKAFDTSKYQNRGTCQCDQRNLTCECKDGFGQFMCSAILKRICKVNKTESRPRCNKTNVEQCSVKTDNNEDYICNIFKESDVELIKTLSSCI